MNLRVELRFRLPNESFDRTDVMTISAPGTKITPRMAQYVAQQFLARFEHGSPAAVLKAASCTANATGQPVFELTFHAESDAVESTP